MARTTLFALAALAWAAAFGQSQDQSPGFRLQIEPALATSVQGPPAQPAPSVGESPAPGAESYRVDAGDKVSITVYGEPDLSVSEITVRGDGSIAFPLIGDLSIRGLTARDLKELVARRLADGYLKNPNVTVSIDKYRLFYIKGEVNKPGGYNYVEGLTVEKAVAIAGGFTPRASERKITVVRETNPARPIQDAGLNAPVYPGDVITIGESFF